MLQGRTTRRRPSGGDAESQLRREESKQHRANGTLTTRSRAVAQTTVEAEVGVRDERDVSPVAGGRHVPALEVTGTLLTAALAQVYASLSSHCHLRGAVDALAAVVSYSQSR